MSVRKDLFHLYVQPMLPVSNFEGAPTTVTAGAVEPIDVRHLKLIFYIYSLQLFLLGVI